jgi:GNAT superfamily N-acetyltransferase
LVRAGDPSARGLVAFDARSNAESILGWMKLVARASIPKLRRLPAYRSLDLGEDAGVWSIGCFLVHPQHRNRGIARVLLSAAEAQVRAWGGRTIEAYPRRSSEALRDDEVWMGPEALFAELGFSPVHDASPYPVWRKLIY